MTAPTLAPIVVDADVMAAAALAAGQDLPDASPAARALAAAALEAADRQVMDDLVDAVAGEHTPSGRSGPRVSDYGTCRRQVWYREYPPAGFVPEPARYDRHAALGALVHDKAAAVRATRYPWRRYEVELTMPGLDRPGRADEYDPVLGEVVEVKTAGARKWDLIGDDGPTETWWGQVLLYALALDEMGLPVRTVRIIVVNRDTGAEEHFHRPYDPAAARAALDDLLELATMLDADVVPRRDGAGPNSDWQCRSCFARTHCWNLEAAAEAGRSPESYTILGAEPGDPTIAWAAAQVVDANSAYRAAAKRRDEVRPLLDGIPAGEYSDYVISPTRREMPDYKESFERVVQLYALSEANRPPAEEVAVPVTRVDRYVTVKRKRAAHRKDHTGRKVAAQ